MPRPSRLALLLSLKSLEMHGRRDVFVLVFICFFLLLANFFHAQGLASAAWMLATVIVLLADDEGALHTLAAEGWEVPGSGSVGSSHPLARVVRTGAPAAPG